MKRALGHSLALVPIALVLAGSIVPAQAASQRDAMIQRWESAQRHAISKTLDRKARAAATRAFSAERSALVAPAAAAPPRNLAALVKRELAIPGRYQLAPHAVAPRSLPWWVRAMNWLGDRWNDAMRKLFGRAKLAPGQATAIGDLLIGLAALVLIVVAVRLIAVVQFERRARARAVEALETPPDPAQLYARSCERARAGDFSVAATLLFAAAVAALDLRGDVRNRRSATVGDLRRNLRDRDAALVPGFNAIAAPFVIGAYAQRPVRGDEWEAAREAFLSLPRGEAG